MTSSTSSSSRALALALAAACACGCAGTRGARAPAFAPGRRVAVLPLENLAGAPLPAEALQADVEAAVARAGLAAVERAALDAFLAEHRVRWTGGVDRAVARALHEELRVDAVVVTSVLQYAPGVNPKVALLARLVDVTVEPAIAWIDGAARSGDESPGLFGLGRTSSVDEVRREVTGALARSLAAFVRGKGPGAPTCDGGDAFRPKVAFRAPELAGPGPVSVAVLPFVDDTPRRTGGGPVALELVRHLVATRRFRVLEPGVVRSEVIRFRIVQEEGVSLEQARLVADVLDVDLVVAGRVSEHEDPVGSPRPPAVSFGVQVLERTERRVLWESTSRNGGDDAASLFGTRRVRTASALACRMVKNVVAGMVDGGGAPARPVRPGAPRPASEGAHQGPGRPESAQGLRRDLARIDRISPFS